MTSGPLVLTGGGGWFGLAYLHALAQGPRPAECRVLVGRPAEVPAVLAALPSARVHVGDVADPDVAGRLLAGAREATVVHAAAVIHPARVAEFDRVNVGGTAAVLDAAVRAGARRMVHLSSNSVAGVNPSPEDVFRAEEPYRPWLGYGTSKMRAELLVRAAHREGRLPTVVVRAPWFYGPWQPERQTRFLEMVAAGRFPVLGDGRQRRSMVYVGNLVQAVRLAQDHPSAPGGAFWAADARPYPLAEIVATVRQVLAEEGVPVARRTLRLPAALGRAAERADRALQARGRYVSELHVLGELDKTIACDVEATVRVLGYRPEVDLAEGMRRAVRWCRVEGIDLGGGPR